MKPESEVREKREEIQSKIDAIQKLIEGPKREGPSMYELSKQAKFKRQVAMLDWVLEDA